MLLDDSRPAGSTGLTEATLALKYDPTVLKLAPADVTLGSIPNGGTGWQLSAVVDPTTGQVAVELFSFTPIMSGQGGSLVNINFAWQDNTKTPSAAVVQLVPTVILNGRSFSTTLADSLGGMIVSTGLVQVTLSTGVDPSLE